MARTGINPVTIRGQNQLGQPFGIAIGRLHFGIGAITEKMVSVVVFPDRPGAGEADIIAFAKFDEDHFVNGLLHLFPRGDLNQMEGSPAPLHDEALNLLTKAAAELSGPLKAEIATYLSRTTG